MADTFVPVTFVADELLTSTKMNLLAANQAGFHDGTALGDGIIASRHVATGAIDDSQWRNNTSFIATNCASFNVPTATFTKVPINFAQHDPGSNFNTVTSRYEPEFDGEYHFDAKVMVESTAQAYRYILAIYVNGVEAKRIWDSLTGGGSVSGSMNGSCNILINAGDYVELFMWHGVGSTRSYPADTSGKQYILNGHLVSRI